MREDAPQLLPRDTTPTWEVELLISGVAVFAMLILPGLLDDALFALLPRFDGSWQEPIDILYLYLKSAAVILAATFAIHLLLRANWIALVGMYSVFPEGVRLERMRMGPVQRAFESQRAAAPDEIIDRADNRATVVFAVGVNMAMTLVGISVLIALTFGILLAALSLGAVPIDASNLFLAAVGFAVAPFGIAVLIDRRLGPRMSPRGTGARVLATVYRCYRPFGFNRGGNALAFVASNGSERRVALLAFVIFLPVMLGVLMGLRALRSPEAFGGYGLFPDPPAESGRKLDAAHYDRLRDASRDPSVPYIQDAVAVGPWLRLAVPFQPGTDAAALRSTCKEGLAAGESLAGVRVLECLQRVHAVALDGHPVRTLRYDAGTDPRTDRPVLVAMLDVRGLAPGRHELRVARTDVVAGSDETPFWVIPFWR